MSFPSSFNAKLRMAGIDPASVLLVRHADRRQKQLFEIWRSGDPRFDGANGYVRYQKLRTISMFQCVAVVAHFIGILDGHGGRKVGRHAGSDSLFIGLWELSGDPMELKPGQHDPLVNTSDDTRFYAEEVFHRIPHLQDCEGRVLIEWGRPHTCWRQYARNCDKPVTETLPQSPRSRGPLAA